MNKTATVAVLLTITAGLIGYRSGFFARIIMAVSGDAKVKGS